MQWKHFIKSSCPLVRDAPLPLPRFWPQQQCPTQWPPLPNPCPGFPWLVYSTCPLLVLYLTHAPLPFPWFWPQQCPTQWPPLAWLSKGRLLYFVRALSNPLLAPDLTSLLNGKRCATPISQVLAPAAVPNRVAPLAQSLPWLSLGRLLYLPPALTPLPTAKPYFFHAPTQTEPNPTRLFFSHQDSQWADMQHTCH